MSKGKIITLIVAAILVAGSVYYALYSDARSVTLNPVNTPFKLYGDSLKGKRVGEIDAKRTLKLQDGQYCAQAKDTKYSQDPVCFTVYKKSLYQDIDFDYSKETLTAILDRDWTTIQSEIANSYKNVIKSYTVCRGEILKKGDWYIGTIRDKIVTASDSSDYYRIILQKKDNKWTIAAAPQVAISRYSDDTNTIPRDIIQAANTIQPCAPETGIAQPVTN